MKFSVIIPISKKDNCFLKRCIYSFLEQDYKDYEIIVVGSGNNKKARGICETLSPLNERIKYFDIEKENAASKRNTGFDMSNGDIVYFFDADCTLLPGMLRILKDKLEDNPDCDFIYSAYRWNVESLNTFPSRPFDPYLLETANYISTMSPMRREIFPRFRDDLEFFQDWDLFLRITKKGHKGFYLPDATFITEPIDNKSISGCQKKSYLERVQHIRKINNISEKPICVSTLGAPYQAIQRAKILGADYFGCHQGSPLIQSPSLFEHKYEMIYVMGFYPSTVNDHANLLANLPKGCLKVIQWIGTDVWQLRTRFNWETIKYMRDKILKHIDVQLCNSEHLEKELGELGIKAHTVYMPLLENIEEMPLPKKFTVGVYYSDTNFMHNEEFLADVAKSMPDIDFIFFGGSKRAKEENIEYIPWTNIKDILKRCSMNVRITVHDGFPHTPIHFLLAGRQVITNFEMPFTHFLPMQVNETTHGQCKIKLIEKIREVKKKPNKKHIEGGRKYYKERLDPKGYKKIINSILKEGKNWIFKEDNG